MEEARAAVIVVDTNVICYHWMPSPHSAAAEHALTRDTEWVAPFLWRSEFRNALVGALRRKVIGLADAVHVVEEAERQFEAREFFVSSRAVMKMVERSDCSAYDCEFVALAAEHGVPLITVDRQVLKNFPKLAVSLEEFVAG